MAFDGTSPWGIVSRFRRTAPHKAADNDNDDPPAIPARVAVALPVPAFEPADGLLRAWNVPT